ncbi:serine hydrolase [Sphingomonas sp. I4]
MAIFQHRLCRGGHDRREGIGPILARFLASARVQAARHSRDRPGQGGRPRLSARLSAPRAGPRPGRDAGGPGWLYAAGELSMSPQDLAKWDVARMNRTLLPPKTWAEQENPVKLTDGSNTNYGLGVSVGTADGRRFVEHSGEAVGFLTENIVYPDDKAAVVVAVNAWFADAQSRIAKGIADTVLPAPQASAEDAAALARTKSVYAQLQAGQLDQALLTEDAAYYFTPATIADYRTSLSPLGAQGKIEQTGRTRLRGGFVNRSYRVTYPNRTLRISTYAEPGANGRIEQFLVSPAE